MDIFCVFPAIIALHVQFLKLTYIVITRMYIYIYMYTYIVARIRGLEKITNRYIVVVNLLSLRMTPKRGECCAFFFLFVLYYYKTATTGRKQYLQPSLLVTTIYTCSILNVCVMCVNMQIF